MILRWLLTAMAALTLVLAGGLGLASPAYAKGPTELVISGPGLDEPIAVGSEEDRKPPLVHDFLDASGGAESLYGGGGLVRRAREPRAGELGPRYTLTFSDPSATLLVQDVYPFAVGGPLSYTPPGQILGRTRVPSRWYQASEILRTHLTKIGVPIPASSSGPATAAPTPVAKVSPGAGSGSGSVDRHTLVPILWLGVVGVTTAAVGFGTGALLVRRSSIRQPD